MRGFSPCTPASSNCRSLLTKGVIVSVQGCLSHFSLYCSCNGQAIYSGLIPPELDKADIENGWIDVINHFFLVCLIVSY